MTDPVVLVAGAGPVGLTMAAELLRQGVPTRLIERVEQRSPWSKALVVWQRTLELLEALGATEPLIARDIVARHIRLFGDAAEVVAVPLAVAGSRRPQPVFIPQYDVESVLEEALVRQGGRIERGSELTGFVDRGDRIAATIRRRDGTEETVEVAWLVGCDGARSVVRRQLGLEFTTTPIMTRWVMGDVAIAGREQADEAHMHWNPRGFFGVIPVRPGVDRVVYDGGAIEDQGRPPDPTLEELQAAVDLRGLPYRLSNPTWLTSFVVREARARRYRGGRAIVAGDAAHVHGPAGGQGMNTGMQDAINLAWKLAAIGRGGDAELLLQSYEQERGAVGDYVIRLSGTTLRVSALRNPVLRVLRNTVVRALGRTGAFRRRMARQFSQLTIGYPDSPLNLDGRDVPRGALRPGDRLPEATLRDDAGRPVALADLFNAGRARAFALVGADGAADGADALAQMFRGIDITRVGLARAPAGAGGDRLADPEGALHQMVCGGGDHRRLLLVRPDRHVMANVPLARAGDAAQLARRVFAAGG